MRLSHGIRVSFHTASECQPCLSIAAIGSACSSACSVTRLCAAFRVPTAVLTAVGAVVLLRQVDVVESWPVGDVHPPPAALALRFVVYEPSHVLLSCSVVFGKAGRQKKAPKAGWFR